MNEDEVKAEIKAIWTGLEGLAQRVARVEHRLNEIEKSELETETETLSKIVGQLRGGLRALNDFRDIKLQLRPPVSNPLQAAQDAARSASDAILAAMITIEAKLRRKEEESLEP